MRVRSDSRRPENAAPRLPPSPRRAHSFPPQPPPAAHRSAPRTPAVVGRRRVPPHRRHRLSLTPTATTSAAAAVPAGSGLLPGASNHRQPRSQQQEQVAEGRGRSHIGGKTTCQSQSRDHPPLKGAAAPSSYCPSAGSVICRGTAAEKLEVEGASSTEMALMAETWTGSGLRLCVLRLV